MATFRNARLELTGSFDTVYLAPSGVTAIVIGAQATNVDGEDNVPLSLRWLDASEGDAETVLLDEVPVPFQAALEPIGGRLVLEPGDALQAQARDSDEIVLTVSVLELS